MKNLKQMAVAAVLFAVMFSQSVLAGVNSKIFEKSLSLIANKKNVSVAALQVLNTAEVNLPLSGVRYFSSKVLDPTTDSTFSLDVDVNGNTVDGRALSEQEDALYRAKYGKLTPELFDAINKRGLTAQVRVAFWVGLPGLSDGSTVKTGNLSISPTEITAITARRDQEIKAAVGTGTTGLVDALRGLGLVADRFDFSPIVVVSMKGSDVAGIAARPEVSQALLAEGQAVPYLFQSARTIGANFNWGIGNAGTSQKVAVVEGGAVDFSNPFLGAVNDGTCGNPYGTGGVSDHPTVVAGIIASQHPTHRGIANNSLVSNGGGIYSAPGLYSSNSSLLYAMDCGASRRITNNSWGYGVAPAFPDIFTTHADFIVRDRWVQEIAASGNSGGFNQPANAVGGGYNTIAVGSTNDQKTGLNLLDDVMSSFSTFKNPNACYLCGTSKFGDFEKPEVVAPGEQIISTRMGTAVSNAGSGTSYASPMIAGVDALIQQLNTGLSIYPETKRSIILASARHNIEGAPAMSDKDGAGLVDTVTAYQTTVNNRFDWKFITAGAPFNGSGDYFVTLPAIPTGGKIKVAYNWLSNASGTWNSTSDRLEYDLDMTVYDPSNNVVGGSYKWADSKEVVQFTANVAGNYKVKIHRFSNCPSPRLTYAALAWSIN